MKLKNFLLATAIGVTPITANASLFSFFSKPEPKLLYIDNTTLSPVWGYENTDEINTRTVQTGPEWGEDSEYFPQWDWWEMNSKNWMSYNGLTIPHPYSTGNYSGSVGSEIPRIKDGWRLFAKRFTCEEHTGYDSCTVPSSNRGQTRDPFFMLYNRYTGIMRTYIYVDEANGNGDDTYVVTVGLSNNNGRYALLQHEADEATPQSNHSKMAQIKRAYTFPTHKANWLVMETEMAYDPDSVPDGLHLIFEVYKEKTQDIELSGKFEFTLRSGGGSGGSSGKSEVGTLMKAGSAAFGGYKAYMNGYKEAEKQANKWKNDDNENIAKGGQQLLSLLNAVGGANPYIAAGTAVFQAVSVFGGKSKPKVSISYGEGSISLDGRIRSSNALLKLAVGVPGSTLNPGDYNNAPLLKQKLGVYGFEELPELDRLPSSQNEKGYSTSYVVLQGNSKVYVNKRTSFKLKALKYRANAAIKRPRRYERGQINIHHYREDGIDYVSNQWVSHSEGYSKFLMALTGTYRWTSLGSRRVRCSNSGHGRGTHYHDKRVTEYHGESAPITDDMLNFEYLIHLEDNDGNKILSSKKVR